MSCSIKIIALVYMNQARQTAYSCPYYHCAKFKGFID